MAILPSGNDGMEIKHTSPVNQVKISDKLLKELNTTLETIKNHNLELYIVVYEDLLPPEMQSAELVGSEGANSLEEHDVVFCQAIDGNLMDLEAAESRRGSIQIILYSDESFNSELVSLEHPGQEVPLDMRKVEFIQLDDTEHSEVKYVRFGDVHKVSSEEFKNYGSYLTPVTIQKHIQRLESTRDGTARQTLKPSNVEIKFPNK